MRWWEQQIGGTTRGRLIALIRRGIATVEELAADLGVTDNAVRAQLQTLETAGVIRAAGTRQGSGAGKPATVYEITPDAEPALSSAYPPVLAALLESLVERLPPGDVDNILRDAGKRLGQSDTSNHRSLDTRVRAAASILTSLGAEIDVERTKEGFVLRGYACPLAAAVRAEPRACHVIEELVSALVDAPVRECCDRSASPRCRFEVLARSA
ncbi:MAG: regulatory protein ArsR [Gemmatimonadetes bacterium]|nr:regulatory protein ArsR [Gemmatimonadota bacterium]